MAGVLSEVDAIITYFECAHVASLLSDKADVVPGYDFLVNSVWPEMIKGIEERLAYLFNPGNPDIFYEVQPQWHCRCVRAFPWCSFLSQNSVMDWVVSPPCAVCWLFIFCFLALQCKYGVCAEVWASVQLAGQCEETESTSLIYQLQQQMEPACLLSTTVNITSIWSMLDMLQPTDSCLPWLFPEQIRNVLITAGFTLNYVGSVTRIIWKYKIMFFTHLFKVQKQTSFRE